MPARHDHEGGVAGSCEEEPPGETSDVLTLDWTVFVLFAIVAIGVMVSTANTATAQGDLMKKEQNKSRELPPVHVTLRAQPRTEIDGTRAYEIAFETCSTFAIPDLVELADGKRDPEAINAAVVNMLPRHLSEETKAGCRAGFQSRPDGFGAKHRADS